MNQWRAEILINYLLVPISRNLRHELFQHGWKFSAAMEYNSSDGTRHDWEHKKISNEQDRGRKKTILNKIHVWDNWF
jgi:hypothetical protein